MMQRLRLIVLAFIGLGFVCLAGTAWASDGSTYTKALLDNLTPPLCGGALNTNDNSNCLQKQANTVNALAAFGSIAGGIAAGAALLLSLQGLKTSNEAMSLTRSEAEQRNIKFQLEMRPWLSANVELDGPFSKAKGADGKMGFGCIVRCTLLNHGKTPAKNVIFDWRIKYIDVDKDIEKWLPEHKQIEMPGTYGDTILPGQTIILKPGTYFPKIENWDYERCIPTILGVVMYRDWNTDAEYAVRFIYFLEPISGIDVAADGDFLGKNYEVLRPGLVKMD